MGDEGTTRADVVGWQGCRAPGNALYVLTDGMVASCCRTNHYLGDARQDLLSDIWHGQARQDFAAAVDAGQLSIGCGGCAREHEVEGRAGTFAAHYDDYPPPSDELDQGPALLGLYFSNTCNLQCTMCDGTSSSSIRLHREHLPPIKTSYDDRFFDDLRDLLPHVKALAFAGGEPFLIPEAIRTWELMAEVAPDVPATIITNGTYWSPRVERALEGITPNITVSIDGATAETYESIRHGASWDGLMTNLDRLQALTERKGTDLVICFSLFVDNHHELGAMLELAEARGIAVEVSVVREPVGLSIYAQPVEAMRAILAGLEAQDAELRASLVRNLGVWEAELDRLRRWVAERELGTAAPWEEESILGISRSGGGATDAAWALAELRAALPTAEVAELVVGPGDVIVRATPADEALLGLEPGSAVGRSADVLWGALTARWGSGALALVGRSDDWTSNAAELERASVRAMAVALRDGTGRADEVALLVAVAPR
ncbi:MAG: radical SAM protein [Acidimicrobiales bacterium]